MKTKRNILYISFLIISVLLYSCQEDNDENDQNNGLISDTPFSSLKEYVTNTQTGIEFSEHYFSISYDTCYVGIYGSINNKLWFGVFELNKDDIDKNTTNIIYEYQEEDSIQSHWSWDKGYGEIETLNFTDKTIDSKFYYTNNYLVFKLYQNNGNESSYQQEITYTITPQRTIKNEAVLNPQAKLDFRGDQSKRNISRTLNTWTNNTVLTEHLDSIGIDNTEPLYCYDDKGELIYKVGIDRNDLLIENNSILDKSIFPCSINEYIKGYTSKINIESGDTAWINNDTKFNDIPSDARLDKFELLKKETTTFHFRLHYTLFNGEKVTKDIMLNTDNGEIN